MLEVMKMNKLSIETKLFMILYKLAQLVKFVLALLLVTMYILGRKVMFSVVSACPRSQHATTSSPCSKTEIIFFIYFITARNGSCGKVMFSQVCVIPSVHGGRGPAQGSMLPV